MGDVDVQRSARLVIGTRLTVEYTCDESEYQWHVLSPFVSSPAPPKVENAILGRGRVHHVSSDARQLDLSYTVESVFLAVLDLRWAVVTNVVSLRNGCIRLTSILKITLIVDRSKKFKLASSLESHRLNLDVTSFIAARRVGRPRLRVLNRARRHSWIIEDTK